MTMRMDRREFLGATALTASLAALPAWAQGTGGSPELARLFDDLFNENLRRRPEGATQLGLPVSTTHVVAGSIMGVGSSRRFSAVRWGVAGNMLVAWVVTIPITFGLAAVTYLVLARGLHLG